VRDTIRDGLRPLDHTKMPPDLENPYVKITLHKDAFETIHARPIVAKKKMEDLTKEFFDSLKQPIPHNDSMDITNPNIFDSTSLVNIHIYGGPGCFPAGTLVALPDGTWKRIEDFGIRHEQKLNEVVQRIKKNLAEGITKATCFHIYHDIPCFEIITNAGRRIECSYNQPFFQRQLERTVVLKKIWKRKKDWIWAEKLSVGDEIRVSSGTPNTCTRKKILKPKNLYRKEKTRIANDGKEFVLDENLASLFGYAFGDGSLHKHNGIPYEVDMVVNETELDLIPQLQSMAQNCGIAISVHKKNTPRTSKIGDREIIRRQEIYTVSIYGLRYTPLFAFLMEKSTERKPPMEIMQSPKTVVSAFLRWYYEADGCCSSSIERGKREIGLKSRSTEALRFIQLLLMGYGIQAKIRKDALGIRRKKDIVTFAKEIGFASEKKKKALQKLVDCEVQRNFKSDHYESIVSIKPINNRTVYDLTTQHHEFIANGFKVHNSGKTTMARSIGESIHNHYGDNITHCIEASYIPEAIAAMDPSKSVFVLSIDDPMREQDARKPNDPVVDEACQSFFEIRHILMRSKVRYQLKEYLGVTKLPRIDEQLITTEQWTELAKKYPPNLIKCSALIFTIFGPQVPQLDQRLHLSKIWEIYKAYGSLDVARRAILEKELQEHYYVQHLKDNEKLWRIDRNMTYMSRSLVKDPFGERRCGWVWIFPPKKMVFEPIARGERRHQERLKNETELLDEWARFLFFERKNLHPAYTPHEKIHDRRTAINNFIRDTVSSGIDPRSGEALSSQDQVFFRRTRNLCTVLDDRISKIFAVSADEERIKAMAEALIIKAEEEEINPFQRSAQALFRALSHKIESRDDEFLRKKGIWTRIFDEIIFMWVKKHGAPEESEEGLVPRDDGAARVPMLTEQIKEMMKTKVEGEKGDAVKFELDLQDAITLVLQDRPDLQNGADIYCSMYSLCGKDHMTCREMSVNSMTLYKEQFTEEQVRYRKEVFEGLLNQRIGDMFEMWLEAVLNEGYEIPGILEDVEKAERVGGLGKPDILLTHTDGRQSVGAAKCYTSQRTESFEKAEFNPELMYHSRLLRDKGKIILIYRNLGIKDMLSVKVFDSSIDVPQNVFFSPKDAGSFIFRKKKTEENAEIR
jgi:intein/homing endonuclease